MSAEAGANAAPTASAPVITSEELAQAGEILGAVQHAFSGRVVGQERLRTALLVALLAEGHILVESVPGLAKTQSAMLEAMQESQTSIAGVVHRLPTPFMVLATQNPIEEEGTYVLPRAQMDRFLLKEVLDYPSVDEEVQVLERIENGTLGRDTHAQAVIGHDHVHWLHALTKRVYVDPSVKRYVASLVAATRGDALPADVRGYVDMGASPRATVAFFQASRALALMSGRNHVLPEDVRTLRHGVLRHRVHLSFEALAERVRVEEIIDAVVKTVPSP